MTGGFAHTHADVMDFENTRLKLSTANPSVTVSQSPVEVANPGVISIFTIEDRTRRCITRFPHICNKENHCCINHHYVGCKEQRQRTMHDGIVMSAHQVRVPVVMASALRNNHLDLSR